MVTGWYPHEGGLLKYMVQIRFGEEPDTMPEGWKFGRVSAVPGLGGMSTCSTAARKRTGRGLRPQGKFLRSWGKAYSQSHGIRIDKHDMSGSPTLPPSGHGIHHGGQAAAHPGHERQGRRHARHV